MLPWICASLFPSHKLIQVASLGGAVWASAKSGLRCDSDSQSDWTRARLAVVGACGSCVRTRSPGAPFPSLCQVGRNGAELLLACSWVWLLLRSDTSQGLSSVSRTLAFPCQGSPTPGALLLVLAVLGSSRWLVIRFHTSLCFGFTCFASWSFPILSLFLFPAPLFDYIT